MGLQMVDRRIEHGERCGRRARQVGVLEPGEPTGSSLANDEGSSMADQTCSGRIGTCASAVVANAALGADRVISTLLPSAVTDSTGS